MPELEGVIKYQLHHQQQQLLTSGDLQALNAWRTILFQLNLIGQLPHKYAGLGFGNISYRLVPGSEEFIISSTQTGHLPTLNDEHYVLIHNAKVKENSITSSGLNLPSSETLTHASVYQQNPAIQAVIHVHSPDIWLNTVKLGLPHTAANIAYGTPAMAQAVAALVNPSVNNPTGLFSMLGHEDGVVAYGPSLNTAACLLITQLVNARS